MRAAAGRAARAAVAAPEGRRWSSGHSWPSVGTAGAGAAGTRCVGRGAGLLAQVPADRRAEGGPERVSDRGADQRGTEALEGSSLVAHVGGIGLAILSDDQGQRNSGERPDIGSGDRGSTAPAPFVIGAGPADAANDETARERAGQDEDDGGTGSPCFAGPDGRRRQKRHADGAERDLPDPPRDFSRGCVRRRRRRMHDHRRRRGQPRAHRRRRAHERRPHDLVFARELDVRRLRSHRVGRRRLRRRHGGHAGQRLPGGR